MGEKQTMNPFLIVCMVLILDGSSELCAHLWNKAGISIFQSICLHQSRQIQFFSGNTFFTLKAYKESYYMERVKLTHWKG